ncbi:MAG: hypothetical protein UT67_C0002G0015 [Candidatus Magasanikbacteria bacterium GW2011_GWA2_40_10]|uniref:DUF3784 domain-containing protein n=1 Tax=Candidatus Magasanikbacteria bacterium GW2011_GWA2_40_10 TaxID=1619037 RepID=A0A0G0QDK2_9BACT|nr:MAG: hypothetical protein UT67_C0002G0015 [Candidatus Magasanikbacteria bacterium GW2011_GWA2_40_10]
MRYFIGILLVVVGLFLILKTEWFIQNFGTNAWAEEHLGYNGGTRLMYKVIGLIFIFFGFLAITNMINGFLMGTVVKIFVR